MTRITTLVENRPGAHRSLATEHGLSMLVEHDGHTLLFDTGQSGGLVHNARLLRIDLSAVEAVVLSHGHYDHTNGLPYLVEAGVTGFDLYVGRSFFDPKFSTDGYAQTYLGPSWDRTWCTGHARSLHELDDPVRELVPGVHAIGSFERTHDCEGPNPRFVVQRAPAAAVEVDDFRDEVSLAVETPKGLVVLVGCSHPGIMNMLDTVRWRFDTPIHAVLGGTHLVEAHGERLEEALAYLTDDTIPLLGLSHCTGDAAMDRLATMTTGFYRNVTGSSYCVISDPS